MRELLDRMATWWLDRSGQLMQMECLSYGGTMADGRVRVCGKWRHHTDSHAYDIREARVH